MSSSNIVVGLFYGSSTCYTEIAAEKIRDYLLSQHQTETILHNIADTGLLPVADFDVVIFGIPTWDYGELQEDWDRRWDELDSINFIGKTLALYGLGDQIGYPEWFQDAMGYLYFKLMEKDAHVIGFWPSEGYQFNQSQALTKDKQHFVGLPLDDENELDLSEQRIQNWCDNLMAEIKPNL